MVARNNMRRDTRAGMGKAKSFDHVTLISAPWPLFDRPSIQLGVLKAYLRQQMPRLGVRAHHLYLQVAEAIGYDLYRELSNRSWAAECVYGGLLFPERRDRMAALFHRTAPGGTRLKKTDYRDVLDRVRAATQAFIRDADFKACGLAGFSVCYSQLTSSLYLIREIKQAYPDVPVAAGGSLLVGATGRDVFRMFPEIDYLVQGEGEQVLAGLVKHVQAGGPTDKGPAMPGLLTRQCPDSSGDSSWQVDDLGALPVPDYDDYFDLLCSFLPNERFFPALPAEMSRGCWWCSSTCGGCRFCNLNRQWTGYRAKSPARIRAEVDRMTDRHQVLRVAFMDNLLPVNGSRNALPELAGLKKDLDLFGEIRASTPRKRLEEMRAAGFREVQVGIESLSTGLLKKMNKGVSVIENLEIMRNCEELGLVCMGNLIVRYPGSDETDAAETLRAMEFAMAFRPLNVVGFWLGQGSPIWRDRRKQGLTSTGNHPNYGVIFPPEYNRHIRFPIQTFRGGKVFQRKIWAEVEKKAKEWQRQYRELRSGPTSRPILSYADGGSFLVIRQRRLSAEPLNHRLTGVSREIYLFCRRHRKLERIQSQFPQLNVSQLRGFLRMMTDKRLMFEEGGRYLSLAVHSG